MIKNVSIECFSIKNVSLFYIIKLFLYSICFYAHSFNILSKSILLMNKFGQNSSLKSKI